MRYVRLGNTGLEVSRLGLDCHSLGVARREQGWDPISYDGRVFAIRTVHAALDAGINVFDTSPDAGGGRAESVLGEAIKGRRKDILLASKIMCGHPQLTTEDRILASLRRLRTDRIDILYLNDAMFDEQGLWERHLTELQGLCTRGTIGHIGLLVTDPAQALHLIRSGQFEVVQMQCDVTAQGAASDALDACQANGVGVSIEKPIAANTLKSIVSALDPEWKGKSDLRRFCLKYLLGDRRVHTVNVGMRWEYEVAENTSLFAGLEKKMSALPVCA